MEGYVRNIGSFPLYAFKRTVLPGEDVSAEEIYNMYFDTSGATNDKEFLSWLHSTVFRDGTMWKMALVPSGSKKVAPVSKKKEVVETPVTTSRAHTVSTNMNVMKEEIDPKKVLRMSADKCQKILESVDDVRLLKQLLAKASTMPRKQKVCKVISNRLDELT